MDGWIMKLRYNGNSYLYHCNSVCLSHHYNLCTITVCIITHTTHSMATRDQLKHYITQL